MKTILIIEDEPHIARFIKNSLEEAGCQVHTAEMGKRGLIDATSRRPDLILLDLGLPDVDGLELIDDIRTWSNVPIIVLSARSGEQDKIDALNRGADDYLIKPFSMGELLARVNAHLRRYQSNPDSTAIIQMGDITIDTSQRQVSKNNEVIHLTPIEYRLLSFLLRNPQRVLTHQQILNEVWGKGHLEQGHYVRVFMSNLRQKLEDNPSRPKHFLTEIGVGYRLKL